MFISLIVSTSLLSANVTSPKSSGFSVFFSSADPIFLKRPLWTINIFTWTEWPQNRLSNFSFVASSAVSADLLEFRTYALEQCFSTFFCSLAVPFLTERSFWRHPWLWFICKRTYSSEIRGTPRVFQGTQGYRGTPVENHCLITWKVIALMKFGNKTFELLFVLKRRKTCLEKDFSISS